MLARKLPVDPRRPLDFRDRSDLATFDWSDVAFPQFSPLLLFTIGKIARACLLSAHPIVPKLTYKVPISAI
jgi:hypothetical protein